MVLFPGCSCCNCVPCAACLPACLKVTIDGFADGTDEVCDECPNINGTYTLHRGPGYPPKVTASVQGSAVPSYAFGKPAKLSVAVAYVPEDGSYTVSGITLESAGTSGYSGDAGVTFGIENGTFACDNPPTATLSLSRVAPTLTMYVKEPVRFTDDGPYASDLPRGSGAQLQCVLAPLSTGGGPAMWHVTSVTVIAAGTGYTEGDAVKIRVRSGVEVEEATGVIHVDSLGAITSVEVTNGGQSYSAVVTGVTLTNPGTIWPRVLCAYTACVPTTCEYPSVYTSSSTGATVGGERCKQIVFVVPYLTNDTFIVSVNVYGRDPFVVASKPRTGNACESIVFSGDDITHGQCATRGTVTVEAAECDGTEPPSFDSCCGPDYGCCAEADSGLVPSTGGYDPSPVLNECIGEANYKACDCGTRNVLVGYEAADMPHLLSNGIFYPYLGRWLYVCGCPDGAPLFDYGLPAYDPQYIDMLGPAYIDADGTIHGQCRSYAILEDLSLLPANQSPAGFFGSFATSPGEIDLLLTAHLQCWGDPQDGVYRYSTNPIVGDISIVPNPIRVDLETGTFFKVYCEDTNPFP